MYFYVLHNMPGGFSLKLSFVISFIQVSIVLLQKEKKAPSPSQTDGSVVFDGLSNYFIVTSQNLFFTFWNKKAKVTTKLILYSQLILLPRSGILPIIGLPFGLRALPSLALGCFSAKPFPYVCWTICNFNATFLAVNQKSQRLPINELDLFQIENHIFLFFGCQKSSQLGQLFCVDLTT